MRFTWQVLQLLLGCWMTVHLARATTLDMVTVANPGNASDAATGGLFGGVTYSYQIAKYEITKGQYAEFLNAVAKSDPYFLYDFAMASNLNVAGISRSGVSGSYSYSVMNNGGDSASRPITYVCWFDAARFANWMHNGQGTGSTETGAYTLNGAISGPAPAKNIDARFYVPTENEWYKAAYYSPVLNAGAGGYYSYGTQSNSVPGNIVGSGSNQANYRNSVYSVTQSSSTSSSQNYLTNAGAFSNSASYYGTFDQSGNVFEWNDLDGNPGTSRGLRGGGWNTDASYLLSSYRAVGDPSAGVNHFVGFRLASPVPVPEPSTWALCLTGLACGLTAVRRRCGVRQA